MKRPDGVLLISIYHFFCAVTLLLGLCGVITLPFIVSVFTEGDRVAIFWTGLASLFGLGFFGFIFLVNLIVGLGLWQMKEWARLAAMVIAIFRLPNFPVGTFIGVFIIWYLLQEKVAAQFSR